MFRGCPLVVEDNFYSLVYQSSPEKQSQEDIVRWAIEMDGWMDIDNRDLLWIVLCNYIGWGFLWFFFSASSKKAGGIDSVQTWNIGSQGSQQCRS